jgi:hypothetical protein
VPSERLGRLAVDEETHPLRAGDILKDRVHEGRHDRHFLRRSQRRRGVHGEVEDGHAVGGEVGAPEREFGGERRDEALAGRAALQLGKEGLQVRARARGLGDVALFGMQLLVVLSRKKIVTRTVWTAVTAGVPAAAGETAAGAGVTRRNDRPRRFPVAATRGRVRSTVATTAAARTSSRIAAARRVMT